MSKKYERIREILNSCDNSRMRDVDIQEIELDDANGIDIDADVKQFCGGKELRCEKFDKKDGTVVFDISIDGLNQRVTYMELVESK